jgi:hypothetical protein
MTEQKEAGDTVAALRPFQNVAQLPVTVRVERFDEVVFEYRFSRPDLTLCDSDVAALSVAPFPDYARQALLAAASYLGSDREGELLPSADAAEVDTLE